MMSAAPPHDDRKGHHYYIRMNQLGRASYSSDALAVIMLRKEMKRTQWRNGDYGQEKLVSL